MAAQRIQRFVMAGTSVLLVGAALSPDAGASAPPYPLPTPSPPSTATAVHVAAGKLTSGVDIALRPNTVVSVSGRVLESGTDKPLERVQVSAYSPSGRVVQRADSDSDGGFVLPLAVSARGYAICFRSSHFGGQPLGGTSTTGWAPVCYRNHPWSASDGSVPAAADRVVVTAHDNQPITVRMRPGGVISGRVAHPGSTFLRTTVFVRSIGAPYYQRQFDTGTSNRYRADGLPPAPHGYQVCFAPNVFETGPGYVARCYGTRHWFGFPKQTAPEEEPDFTHPRWPDGATRIRVQPGSVRSGIGVRVQLAGALSGRVVDRTSGAPAGDPAVRVYDHHGRWVGATAAFNGRFRVTGLPPAAADYLCVFPPRYQGPITNAGPHSYQRECYRNSPWTGAKSRTHGHPVRIVRGKTHQHVDVALRHASRIQGTVTSAIDGKPVRSRVFLFTAGGRFLDSERTGLPGHHGEYVFAGLPASRSGYLVCAGRLGDPNLHRPWLRPRCHGSARWDGADTTPSPGATPIRVGADDHRRGVDIALRAGGAVSGRVVGADTGQDVPNMVVSLFDGHGLHLTDLPVKFDGTWTVEGLDPARSYVACAQSRLLRVRYQPSCYQSVRWYRP
jgi:hypothetical protein